MTKTFPFILLFMVACSHGPQPAPNNTQQMVPDRGFRFVNTTTTAINVFLYKTEEDLNASANPILSVRIAPNSKYSFSDTNRMYYMDYYSDNYDFTNWGAYYFNYPKYIINTKAADSIDLSGGKGDKYWKYVNYISDARLFYLKGNALKTTWVAVDYWDTGTVSAWHALTSQEKDLRIDIYKTKIVYHGPDSVGNTIDVTGTVSIGTGMPPVYFLHSDLNRTEKPLGVLFERFYHFPGSSLGTHGDTVKLSGAKNGTYYLKRQ